MAAAVVAAAVAVPEAAALTALAAIPVALEAVQVPVASAHLPRALPPRPVARIMWVHPVPEALMDLVAVVVRARRMLPVWTCPILLAPGTPCRRR